MYEAICSTLLGFLPTFLTFFVSEDDDRHSLDELIGNCADAFGQLVLVNHGQVVAHNDSIAGIFFEPLEYFTTVG